MRHTLLPLAFALAQVLQAQTFVATGGPISDSPFAQEFDLTVSGLPSTIDTLMFGLERMCIDLQYDWLGDLEMTLQAPDGTTAFLIGMDGGAAGTTCTSTCFRNDALPHIVDGTEPYTGDHRPAQQIAVNNGQDPNGMWTLRILGLFPGQTGTVQGWTLTFSNAPMHHTVLHDSDLPIVVINSTGAIPDEPKVLAHMGIINNPPGVRNHLSDPFTDFDGRIGIELRGILSRYFPKKSFGIELWDANDNDTSVAVLGMPAESDWVLYASYSDKSLLNNALAFQLGRSMGHWAPRTEHVELVMDGTYLGTYVFLEKIKRDSQRVAIADLLPTDNAGDELTGGYIVKLDPNAGQVTSGWTSPYLPPGPQDEAYINFRYDEPSDPSAQQQVYISDRITAFEAALNGPDFLDAVNGYAPYIDQRSFIDHMLVNELARNVDAYRRSTFLFKDKDSNGGRLHMGPLWDFDLAFGNVDFCEGGDVTGWAYNANYVCSANYLVPFWWWRFQDDPAFNDSLRCRWNALREGPLHADTLLAWCDTMAARLNESQQRNFRVWPILGYYATGNPAPYPLDHAGEIQELKDWLTARSAWLDVNWPMGSGPCGTNAVAEDPRRPLLTYPDPFTDHITVPREALPNGDATLILANATGRIVFQQTLRSDGSSALRVALPPALATGPYALTIRGEGTTRSMIVVKE